MKILEKNIAERLSLYKELSLIETENKLQEFVNALHDRFGPLPTAVENLVQSMRIKWLGKDLGFELIRMKGDYLYAYFISNQESKFYTTDYFSKMLSIIQSNSNCKLREKNEKLSLIFSHVRSIKDALKLLEDLKVRMQN